jgi:probable phosphoglycerate mutase
MRHGAVDYFDEQGRAHSPDDVMLTTLGESQARAAGELLRGLTIDRVITSGLARTRQTAQIATDAAHLTTPHEHWQELREIRGGRLSALAAADLARAFTAAFSGPAALDTRFLGGESVGELLDRILPAMQRLLDDAQWDTALLVLHGGVNRGLLSWFLTGQRLFLGGIEQEAGCINVIDVPRDAPGALVRAINLSPLDWLHGASRLSTMERLLQKYHRLAASGADRGSA